MMVVGTDPENCTYKCVSGCRRKVESWEDDEDTLKAPDVREKRKLEDDPFYRLEHFAAADGSGRTSDEVRGKEAKASLYQLKAMQVICVHACVCMYMCACVCLRVYRRCMHARIHVCTMAQHVWNM